MAWLLVDESQKGGSSPIDIWIVPIFRLKFRELSSRLEEWSGTRASTAAESKLPSRIMCGRRGLHTIRSALVNSTSPFLEEALAPSSPLLTMTSGRKRFTRVENFYILETLGVGTFAKVRLAIHCVTHQHYACKILDKSYIRQREQNRNVKNEIDALARLNHKNIVQLVEVINTTKRIYIIMELVSGGELFNVITKKNRLTEPQARFYFHQLVEGVHYCHRRGVFHRDLKLENILLSTEGVVKITDFGLSQLLAGRADGMDSVNSSVLLSTQCGSPFYVAPEVVTKDTRYSGAKADAWACGLILYVLAAGSLPFQKLFYDITSNGNNTLTFHKFLDRVKNFPESFSEELKDLIVHLLKLDPAKRYAMPAVKRHPWFNGPCDDPGRHRSENPHTQLPQVVAASLGSVPLTQQPRPYFSGNAIQDPHSAQTVQEDSLMETNDSLNLGKRADSFEGTAPAVLLPMASRYSDVPETETTGHELTEHDLGVHAGVHGVPATATSIALAGNSGMQAGAPYVNGSQKVFEPRQVETTTNDVAFPINVDIPYYKDAIVYNWKALPRDFEVGEYIYLLSQERADVSDEKNTLRRINSMENREICSVTHVSKLGRTRSMPNINLRPSFVGNVRPFQNLSIESKRGTVRQKLWELSVNQWRSEDDSQPQSPVRSTVDGNKDYHLVADSVEFGLADKDLRASWTKDAVFRSIHEQGQIESDDRPVPEIYARKATAQRKSLESTGSVSHISNPYAAKDIRVSKKQNGRDLSNQAIRVDSHNASSSNIQRSGKESSRAPDIERVKPSEKDSLSTRDMARTSSSRGRRMPSSPRTPRSIKDSRRLRSGHSVDKVLLDLSGEIAADQGASRAPNLAHQMRPDSSNRPIYDVYHTLPFMNPFAYETIPGPRVLFPKSNPFTSWLRKKQIYKAFVSRFKPETKPHPQMQFRTLLEPAGCIDILEDVLRDYGCTKVVSSKRSGNRYRIRCSSAQGGADNSAVLTVSKVDSGLSGIHFESRNGDPSYLQDIFRAVTTGFRARTSWNSVDPVNSEKENNED